VFLAHWSQRERGPATYLAYSLEERGKGGKGMKVRYKICGGKMKARIIPLNLTQQKKTDVRKKVVSGRRTGEESG